MKLINKNDSIFIPGSSGMVGSAIKRRLLDRGFNNLLIPRRNSLDLLDFSNVDKWFSANKPEIVILAAAKVGGIDANFRYQADFILENLKIQTNVIECALKHKVKRFLFLGSSCIYPKLAPQPMKEECFLSGELELTNKAYAVAKISGIQLCASLKKQYNFDAISLMPTNLYGPGDNYHPKNSHVMPALIRKIYSAKLQNISTINCWGSGSPKREFLHVNDLADATIFVLENISSDNKLLIDKNNEYLGILNVGTGMDITIKELVSKISKILEYTGKVSWDLEKPDGTPRKLLDVTKLKTLGWESKITLSQGIKDTINSYIQELKNNTLRN